MEHKIEREWKSIVCPVWKEKTLLMCEWDLLSEEGNISQRSLKQVDCHNPKLYVYGGPDCNWACEKAIAKPGTIRSEVGQLLVSIILAAGILWIAFYNIYIYKPTPASVRFVSFFRNTSRYRANALLRLENDEVYQGGQRISEIASFTSAWHCDA